MQTFLLKHISLDKMQTDSPICLSSELSCCHISGVMSSWIGWMSLVASIFLHSGKNGNISPVCLLKVTNTETGVGGGGGSFFSILNKSVVCEVCVQTQTNN